MDQHERYSQRASRDHIDRIERRIALGPPRVPPPTWRATHYPRRLCNVDMNRLHAQLVEICERYHANDGRLRAAIPIERFCKSFGLRLPTNVNGFASRLRQRLKPWDDDKSALWASYWYSGSGTHPAPYAGFEVLPGQTFVTVNLKPKTLELVAEGLETAVRESVLCEGVAKAEDH